jgi:hypothetical protein
MVLQRQLSTATERLEDAMKTVVGVIAALLTVGIAAQGLLTAQRLSSPPDRVAGLPSRDPGTGATA